MNYFFKWFLLVLAAQLALLGLLWTGLANFGPVVWFVYIFYFVPHFFVRGANISIPGIVAFSIVVISYSLFVASIAYFFRNFREPISNRSILTDD